MSSETKWPKGPYHFLEADGHDLPFNADQPLTIWSVETENDLANVFSCDDSTVSTTREEAVALSHLFAAAPELYAALYGLMHGHDGAIEAGRSALSKARGEK
jgi:hypothetical protein